MGIKGAFLVDGEIYPEDPFWPTWDADPLSHPADETIYALSKTLGTKAGKTALSQLIQVLDLQTQGVRHLCKRLQP